MLSIDELKDDIPFILKGYGSSGTSRHWIESLSGPRQRTGTTPIGNRIGMHGGKSAQKFFDTP